MTALVPAVTPPVNLFVPVAGEGLAAFQAAC